LVNNDHITVVGSQFLGPAKFVCLCRGCNSRKQGQANQSTIHAHFLFGYRGRRAKILSGYAICAYLSPWYSYRRFVQQQAD
jgi:hypothetical protein